MRGTIVAVAVVLVTAGCAQVDEAVGQVDSATDKASVCAEAVGIADLDPLADPERFQARAEDKANRLRELAGNVSDQDVKASLLTMADSYVQVQKERVDDLSVVAKWATRQFDNLDALRAACT